MFKIGRALLISFLVPQLAFAADVPRGAFSKEISGLRSGPAGVAEFFYRSDSDDILVPVHVLGAVKNPGLYHVPLKSNLVTILTVAGGPTAEAQLDEVVVKNQQTSRVEEVDLEDMIRDTARTQDFVMKGNEVVLVKAKQPWVNNNVATTLSVVGGVLATVLSVILIREYTGRR
ncbi:MAG: SLBB domain-containing protein [Bdellovibrionales bacterium]|nr:SLBB domain-containing protein [Bdellovibrionales bacterium]